MSKSIVAFTATVLLLLAGNARAAAIIFDSFNVDEGHFNLAPTFSGSNANIAASSTADRNTTAGASVEGAGFERLVANLSTAGSTSRIRFLSGGGTPANNTAFVTSGATTDGFIGFYLKTTAAGWTAQIALDGPLPDLQGGVPKTVIADGEWHLYEWNLDLASDWGAVASIGGNATFEEGSQTIDSIVFRGSTAAPASSTIDLDFVAKSDSGSIAPLVPEPASIALLAMLAPAMLRRRRAA
jgi:hypothetical protein